MKLGVIAAYACALIYGIHADDVCDGVITKNTCGCFPTRMWGVKIHCKHTNDFNGLYFLQSNITTLELVGMRINFLRHNMFLKLKLKKLVFYEMESYTAFQPWFPDVLSGTNETLEHLEIYHSKMTFGWNIPLSALNRLTHLIVVDSPLYYISESIGKLKSLEYLELRNNELQLISRSPFSELRNLRLLSLSGNDLKEIKREMLPKNPKQLWHLDFSHNNIQTLPDDIFHKMEHLEEVRLDHNRLKSLNKGMFYSIRFLKELWIHDNPLDCKKELGWMRDLGLPVYMWIAQCRTEINTI